MSNADVINPDRGCPSTAEIPAERGTGVDPAPFVRVHPGGGRSLELLVRGARCAGCLNKIEKGVGELSGVSRARLNLTTGRMHVDWQGNIAPRAITAKLSALGYDSQPFEPAEADDVRGREGRALVRALAVAGFATANIMLLSVAVWSSTDGAMGPATRGLMHWVSALIALPAAIYAGQPFFRSAYRALRGGHANMDVPISLAVFLALGISLAEAMRMGEHTYFDASVMLLFFLLIGRTLEHRLKDRARGAAADLLRMQSITARRVGASGDVQAVKAKDLRVGDHVLLMPGDRAPVDATVLEGRSEVDVSLVNGESQPQGVGPDDNLFSGVLNLTQRLMVRVDAVAGESFVADLARMIEAGTQSKAHFVRLADKAASLYVPVVHSLALLTFLGWLIVLGTGMREAILAAAAVLIITCPCALGLAVPAVQTVAVGRLFRRGILVKSGDALERLAQIDTVVFDKTGTLTLGKPALLNPQDLTPDVLAFAAPLARASRHPLARLIAERAGPGPVADDVKETPGQGLRGVVDGVEVRLGRPGLVGATCPQATTTTMWLRKGDATPIRLAFEDALRPDAHQSIDALKRRGLRIAMLSGDSEMPVSRVAAELGIDEWQARLTPQEKTQFLEKLSVSGRTVLMVGDGLNDAPSLASAHVSLSPGTAADASQAAADMVFQGQSLKPVVEAYRVARMARHRVLENFGFAAVYNMCAIPLAMAGLVTPLIAALAMSGSSVVVTLNALRLTRQETGK